MARDTAYRSENVLQTLMIVPTMLDNAKAQVEVEPKLTGSGCIERSQDV
jgi:hypothetical protein